MSTESAASIADYEAILAAQVEEMRAEMSPAERSFMDATLPFMKAARERMNADRAALAVAVAEKAGPWREAWAQGLAEAARIKGAGSTP